MILSLGSCTARPAATPAAPSVPTITLSGTPADMGATHGKQLAEQIRPLHEQYLKQWIKSESQRAMALTIATVFETKLLPEHREELAALSKAAGVDEKEAMLANCFLDLSGMVACSTMTLPASASPDGVARFARNLDFPSFNLADNATVLLVYKPAGRNAFVSVAWPGLIGVLSGMNEHGLAIANMEVTRERRLPSAMPYTLLYRSVLEQCKTVDEAIALLEKTPRQTPNNLMLMDAAGQRAVVELYPDRIDVRHAKPTEALISTNHRRFSDPLASGVCHRYDTLAQQSAEGWGKIDRPALQASLKDVSQDDYTLQSMIFEPANRVMYLSTGKRAATRPMQRIDLKSLLAAENP